MTTEDKRTIGRRQIERRVSDYLRGILPEEERHRLDRLEYSKFLLEDRRKNARRSGIDRREAARVR